MAVSDSQPVIIHLVPSTLDATDAPATPSPPPCSVISANIKEPELLPARALAKHKSDETASDMLAEDPAVTTTRPDINVELAAVRPIMDVSDIQLPASHAVPPTLSPCVALSTPNPCPCTVRLLGRPASPVLALKPAPLASALSQDSATLTLPGIEPAVSDSGMLRGT